MARLPKGIFGPVIGKLGTLTGSTWKGIPYVKHTPEKGATKAERTPAQLANEAKFKYINEWLVPFQPFFSVGFELLAIRKSALAVGLSENYKTVFSGAYPDFEIAYDNLVMSRGQLPSITQVEVMFEDELTLSINWNQNAVTGASYNDQLMFAAYCPELKIADGFIGAVERAQQHHTFRLDEEMAGHALELYITVMTVDRKKIANSLYLGRIEPL